ncbi:MAG: alpha/beta hydrolase-fold protein [Chitinophagaceae bacterium]
MRKNIRFLLTGLSITFCLLSNNAIAQKESTIRDSIYSDILKEKRIISIVLPEGYKKDAKYDVLYVLDGEGNTELTKQIEEFVQRSDFMPQIILVGVHNTNRNRDLTPTNTSAESQYGGANNFLSFLEKELIPYITKKYEVKGSNGLFGHSFGGLFAMYAFLTRPQVFETYLAADPSFWWDKGYMYTLANEKFDPAIHTKKALWITGRGGKESEEMGIPSMDSILKSKAPAGLQWKVVDYPGETHNSVRFKSVYDGLKFFYAGYNKTIQFHPQNGMVLKNKPAKIWLFTPPDNSIRYTTDGTEPTLASPPVQPENILPGAGLLRIKSFSARGSFDREIKAQFKATETWKAIAKPKNAKPGGIRYSYYEGEWDSLPDFKKMKPVLSGIMDKDFRFEKLPRKTNFACVFDGYIEIKEEGYYVFGLDSDDGSKLYLANQLLINADGLHGSGNIQSYIVPLDKGFYPIRVEFFQREGGMNLNLMYVVPSTNAPRPTQIPPELLYSN